MKKIFIILLLPLLLVGCATYYNPITGRREPTLYTEKDEIDMGIAIDKKIQRENTIIETPAHIKKITERIGNVSNRPHLNYTVRVIENPEINAFAIPGGFVYLYTGLLNKIKSDDEIANIIGHEIAHISARDGINRLQKTLLYSIPASIFLRDRSAAIQKAVDTSFTLAMLKYSREQELRADALGVTYAYRAGYDPEGMIVVLRKLQEIERKSPRRISFLATHPPIEDRIEHVKKTIQNLKK